MLKKKTVEDHLFNKPLWIVKRFGILEDRILKLDKVQGDARGNYIGYKFTVDNKRPKLFVEVHIQNTKIRLHLRRLDYKNNTGIKISEAPDTHKWTLTKLVNVNGESDLDAIMQLVKQSYDDIS